MLNDTELKDAIIKFIKAYYKKHKKGPSIRNIFKKFKTETQIKARFYQIFGSTMKAHNLAGVPVSEVHIKQTKKAMQAFKKKRIAEATKEATPWEDLEESYKRERDERRHRKQMSEKLAKQVRMLATDANDEISGRVLDALAKVLPRILKRRYGVIATLPEMIALKKAYDTAGEEGWCVEDVTEWGLLSEEEQADFRLLREEAYEKGLSVHGYIDYLKGEVKDQQRKIGPLSTEIEELKRKKKDLNLNCSLLEARYNRLEKDHEERKKRLDDEYYEKGKNYAIQFSTIKKQFEDEINKLRNERERLKTECERLENETSKIVDRATQRYDKINAEIAERHTELEQLRRLVGPKGTVPDLTKQVEGLKAELKERDQQLAEKAMEVAGKWLNQEETLQIFSEENKRFIGEFEGVCRLVSDELERRIESAGHALYFLEFLESELPDKKFRELTFAINLAEVKRESQNPDNPYFVDLPAKKKELLGAFPTKEEYQRIHREKMERLHKYREADLQRIREVAHDIGMKEIWVNRGIRILDNWVKPVVEAYFNPKKPRQTTPAKSHRRELDRNS